MEKLLYGGAVSRALWLVWRILAIPVALATLLWLVVDSPANGAPRAGLFLVFLVAVGSIALWISEVHTLATNRPKRIVGALTAAAAATALLAGILAIPNPTVATEARSAATPTPYGAASSASSPSQPTATRSVDIRVTVSPVASPASAIDVRMASKFFIENYFPTALRDPQEALVTYGTANFRKQKRRTGVDSYVSWYAATLSIPADQVTVERDGTSPARFDVRFLRVLRSGTTSRVATVYTVACSSSADGPYGCASNELKVDSSATMP